MIFCISSNCSCPKPFSASPCKSFFRVSGALHISRSCSSFLKNSGSLPNNNSRNCFAEMGVPSVCQNVVHTICWMARSLPSASLTFALLMQTQGSCPQTGQGDSSSFGHTQGVLPQTAQGCTGFLSHWHGW